MANNNTQTIKQRVMDILFEDEAKNEVSNKEEVKKEESVILTKPKVKTQGTYKASDLLYGKKDENGKPFINLEEEKKSTPVSAKEFVKSVEEYVSSPNISPMFGTIAPKIKKSDDASSIDYATVEKPESNYLDMVLSPIYGYDSRKANEARTNLEQVKEVKKVESVDVTEDLFATLETKLAESKERHSSLEDESMTKTSEMDLFADFYLDKED